MARWMTATALALLLAACSRELDQSFPWGPGGTPFDAEAAITDLAANGGGYSGSNATVAATRVLVMDLLTGNPLPGATVVVGAPPNTHRVLTTNGAGRADYVVDPSWGGVDDRVLTAAMAGYETLTVDHMTYAGSGRHPAVYVLPLRPNTSAAYAQVRGAARNVSSSDHKKFEASYTATPYPFFAPLDQEGFENNGPFVFFAPPVKAAWLGVLELSSDRAYRFAKEGTSGTNAGAVETRNPSLSSSTDPVISLGGGAWFTFGGPTNSPVQEACRARVLGFPDGAFLPLIVGSNPVDVWSMQFQLHAFAPSDVSVYRGQLHFENSQGFVDLYWDIADPWTAGSEHLDLPPHPSANWPANGSKTVSQTQALNITWPQGTNTGLFEVAVRDPLKAFPENMVWRFWKCNADFNTSLDVGGIQFGTSEGAFNLKPDREYVWRVVRHEDPTFVQDGTCRYGRIPRNTRYSSYSNWSRFSIYQGQQGSNSWIDETLDALRTQGGGVAGDHNSSPSLTVHVQVFDESQGVPIPGVDVFLGYAPAAHHPTPTDAQGRVSFPMPSVRTITACRAGFENSTFWNFQGHVLSIPLRPSATSSYSGVAGTVNNVSSPDAVAACLSTLHATRDERRLLGMGSTQPYSLETLPGAPRPFAAFQQEGGHLTEFDWSLTPPVPTPAAGPAFYNVTFDGASTHPWAQVNDGGTGSFSPPTNMTPTDARAWVLGKGAVPGQAWKTLTTGWGYASFGGGGPYRLDAARVPDLRGLWGAVSVSGTEGGSEARFGIPSLARPLPDLNFPSLPIQYGPADGGFVMIPGLQFGFYGWPNGGESAAGPCVVFVEDQSFSPPESYKWRVFVYPNDSGGTWIDLPSLPAGYSSFDLQLGNTYRWFVRQYQGKYYLRDSMNGFYAGLGRFSMAALEEFLTFKSETNTRTFTVQIP